MTFLAALRPPTPRYSLAPQPSEDGSDASITLVSGPDPRQAIAGLTAPLAWCSTAPLLAPEIARNGRFGTSPFVARALLDHLSRESTPTIAIPRSPAGLTARWRRLADASGAHFLTFGAAGWARVEPLDAQFLLSSFDIPLELAGSQPRIGLLRAERAREPFEFWPSVTHPNSTFRAESGKMRDHTLVELGAGIPFTWLLDLTLGGGSGSGDTVTILAITRDIVAAEVCLIADQQLSWLRAGYEELGPWEDPRIQAACDLHLGVGGGHALVLHCARGDEPANRLAERIARRLDCNVEQHD